jgi:probable HAF family extracellular repeat protein
LLAFAAALVARVSSAEGQCNRYVIQVVQKGCSFGTAATAWGLSEDERLCGSYECGASTNEIPFVWQNGMFTVVPLLPGTVAGRAYSVNAAGHVTGAMTLPTNASRAFFYSNGQTIDLGLLPNENWGQGNSVNSAGIVCGYCNNTTTGPLRSFLWDGSLHELSLPLGPSNVANCLNDAGQVCGWMGVNPTFGLTAHAFLWENGGVTDLGVAPGCTTGEAVAINNNGEIVVRGWTPGPNFVLRSFLWRNGQWTDLGVLPGDTRCYAYDINDNTEIVGDCYGGNVPGKGFLWRDGVMMTIESLIQAGTNLHAGARAINNARTMGGSGAQITPSGPTYAVLFTPVPGLPGDANCDNRINIDDLNLVIAHWGTSGGHTIADVNGDGTVDMADVLDVVNHWTPLRPGDANADGIVNIEDLLIVINAWGPYNGTGGVGTPDLNADGVVDISDMLLVINSWGA